MIGAVLTAIFFGITPVAASRAIKLIGFVRENVLRLLFAVAVLGVWAFAFGQGLRGQSLLFATAGAVGFGIGGMSLLIALPRLGAPLASLVEETIAAPVAAIVAFVWYADKLTNLQLAFCSVILLGVVVGLLPYVRGSIGGAARRSVLFGAAMAVLAAVAQGISLAATRHGMLLMKAAHTPPDVITVSFQRLIGGLLVAMAVYLVARYAWRRRWGFTAADGTRKPIVGSDAAGTLTSRPLYWASLNALFGPILGVTCTVWAQQTLAAGVVQSVAAVAPMIAVPFAFWLEGHKPPRLWYVGAVVAVFGLVVLYLSS